MTYEEGVEGIGDVSLGDVASGQEVLEGLQEVPAGHRLVEVEAVVTRLEKRLKINVVAYQSVVSHSATNEITHVFTHFLV